MGQGGKKETRSRRGKEKSFKTGKSAFLFDVTVIYGMGAESKRLLHCNDDYEERQWMHEKAFQVNFSFSECNSRCCFFSAQFK
jgi:hypothetical protein